MKNVVLETIGKISRRESKYVKRWVYTIDQIQQIRYLKKKQKNKKINKQIKIISHTISN